MRSFKILFGLLRCLFLAVSCPVIGIVSVLKLKWKIQTSDRGSFQFGTSYLPSWLGGGLRGALTTNLIHPVPPLSFFLCRVAVWVVLRDNRDSSAPSVARGSPPEWDWSLWAAGDRLMMQPIKSYVVGCGSAYVPALCSQRCNKCTGFFFSLQKVEETIPILWVSAAVNERLGRGCRCHCCCGFLCVCCVLWKSPFFDGTGSENSLFRIGNKNTLSAAFGEIQV